MPYFLAESCNKHQAKIDSVVFKAFLVKCNIICQKGEPGHIDIGLKQDISLFLPSYLPTADPFHGSSNLYKDAVQSLIATRKNI